MILNEEQIADTLTNFKNATELGTYEESLWTKRHAKDCIDTMTLLWKAVRAARKWVNAPAGFHAVNAEADMVKALDDCL